MAILYAFADGMLEPFLMSSCKLILRDTQERDDIRTSPHSVSEIERWVHQRNYTPVLTAGMPILKMDERTAFLNCTHLQLSAMLCVQ